MALLSYALLTVADAEAFLRISNPTLAEDLVNRASDYCEWYCNRPLKARELANLRYAAQKEPRLRVLATPINTATATLTITLDDTAQTVWKVEASGDQEDFDVVVGADVPGEPSYFYRSDGWVSAIAKRPFPILITYTGGLATIPHELRDAALLVVANLYDAQEKKLAPVAAFGDGPVSPAVTYRAELIPMKAKQILDSYRMWA